MKGSGIKKKKKEKEELKEGGEGKFARYPICKENEH